MFLCDSNFCPRESRDERREVVCSLKRDAFDKFNELHKGTEKGGVKTTKLRSKQKM